MSGVAGDGRKDESLESGFGRLASASRGGAGRRRGRSVSGDAAHHVADGGPGGVERTLGDAAADAGLGDDLAGHERAVGFGHHHIGPLLFVLLERYVAFGCFDLIPIVCKDFNG